ncbi:hypothetical protein MHTCC0001_23720 [Flavobacteriaceae bacterium MHTCC 0001]
MDTPMTLVKASFTAFAIFWAILLTEKTLYGTNFAEVMLLSIIPVAICCAVTICLTIAPFFWVKNEKTEFKVYRKVYFPYYAITLATICTSMIVCSNFNIFMIAFTLSAFFTLLKSWGWIIKS